MTGWLRLPFSGPPYQLIDLYIRRCGYYVSFTDFPLTYSELLYPSEAKQTPSMWPYFGSLGTLIRMRTLFPYIRTIAVKSTYKKDIPPLL